MEFLTKKSKLIHIIFGVICFTLLLSAILYMTQYANIRVLTKQSTDGVISLNGSMRTDDTTKEQYFNGDGENVNITNFWRTHKELGDVQEKMWLTYEYNKSLNQFNQLIVTFAVISLVLFAVMMIVGNQSRKVYYKSNLIVGIVAPACVAVFAIVLLAMNCSLMSRFNENYELFNYISLLMNDTGDIVGIEVSKMSNLEEVKALFNCNTLTFTLYNVYFALILVSALSMIGYAVYRYITSTEKRNAILLKAVESDE